MDQNPVEFSYRQLYIDIRDYNHKKGAPLILRPYEKTSFEERLAGVTPDPDSPMLPLIHKAGSVSRPGRDEPLAWDYFSGGEIMTGPCDVFCEDLVYTFVGRAAFREVPCPVCFIIRPEPELLQNMFIFDTGAYFENRYSLITDNIQDINCFRIPAETDAIRRFIRQQYGDNEGYFFSVAKNIRQFDVMESAEEFTYSVLEDVMAFKNLDFDARCRTLENILRTPISLNKYLEGVILPESQAENTAFRTFCKNADIPFSIMYYDDQQGQADLKTCNVLLDRALYKYYTENGYIRI